MNSTRTVERTREMGRRMRLARRAMGMSVAELAKLGGVTTDRVYLMETGKTVPPRVDVLADLAGALNVSVGWLWGGDDMPSWLRLVSSKTAYARAVHNAIGD